MRDTLRIQQTQDRRRALWRLLVVAATVVAALAVWAVATYVVGVDVRSPQSSAPQVGVASIAVVSAAAALAGWALLAVLERFATRAVRWWAVIATVVTVASLVAPLTTPGFSMSGRVVLMLEHLVVGTVVIALLHRSSPSQDEGSR